MKNIGIKYLLRITTLMPILLVAILFAFFYNWQFNKDLQQHISRLGEAYIRQLLPAAQYALLRHDTRTLQGLINASTVNPEVRALAFYDSNKQLIAYRGGKHSLHKPFNPPAYTGDYIESHAVGPHTINFLTPITLSKFNLYSDMNSIPLNLLNPALSQTDDILGWLSVDIDTQHELIKGYQMLIMTIFITLFGLLMGLTIHYFLSKQIYIPIARLKRSMKQILNNEFETPIKLTGPGELGIIEKGCLHLQQKYLAAHQDLNHQIETTTKDLQQSLELLEEKNIELSLDKRKSEEKNKQQSEFIANMSHEIRTPMNGVIGFTNILLESKLDSLQLDYVKTIKLSAQDLLGIINDILDFSKIDAGKLHLDYIPVDIRSCIDDVLTLAGPNAHKKNLELIAITEIKVPKTVLGDPFRIKQIMTNIITNAVKFTNDGYVLIETKVEHETDRDYSLCISVSDTGIGIAPEDQNKLFTAFSQADTSIAQRYGGSGLGLVICKKLCEAMQGRITLKSEHNKGSTFIARIKIDKLQVYEIEKNQNRRFSDLKVLYLEEHPLHLKAFGTNLNYWGIKSTSCVSLIELNKALSQEEYKIVFINVLSPHEQKIAQFIAAHPHPFYVLIAKNPISNYKELGAYACLLKPLSMQKLQDLMDTIVNETQAKFIINEELDHLRKKLQVLNPQILIADDNPVNKMLMHSLLDDNSQITTVDDGEMVLQVCEEKKFDLLLIDIQMPKVNGLVAAYEIRINESLNKHTPIILISANVNDMQHSELKRAGVDYCIPKPIDEKQLLIHILRIIEKAAQPVIDWQLCIQKVSGNQKLAEELLDKFIEELHKNRAELILLMQQKNIKDLGELAHKINGGCCFCGVPILQKKVIQVEKLALHITNPEDLKEPFAELIQSIDAVIYEYENHYSLQIKN